MPRPSWFAVALLAALVCLWTSIGKAQTVAVGGYPYPPFGYLDGKVHTGYSHDILTEVARRAGLTFHVEEISVVRATKVLHDRVNFLIAGTRTPEAEERYDAHWLDCFETVSHSLMVRADSPFQQLEDIPRTARIAAFLGYTLKSYLGELGFSSFELVAENGQGAEMLMRRRVDAWATFESSAYFLLEERGLDRDIVRSIPIRQFPFCIIASQSTAPELRERLHKAYLEMVADGTRAAIRQKYARYLGPDLLAGHP